MKVPFFIALFCAIQSFAQTTEAVSAEESSKPKLTLPERGLNRFFVDGVIGAGFMRDNSKYYPQNEYGIIAGFRIGNNFYLGKGNNPMVIRLTWLRIGFLAGLKSIVGINPYFIPPQLGLVKHFKITETASIEPGIHVGYIFATEIPFDGIGSFGFGVAYEIKFNVGRFSFGAEYGTRRNTQHYHSSSNKYDRHHYFGLSFGTRFGKGLYRN
jgi:hypothetical protein